MKDTEIKIFLLLVMKSKFQRLSIFRTNIFCLWSYEVLIYVFFTFTKKDLKRRQYEDALESTINIKRRKKTRG